MADFIVENTQTDHTKLPISLDFNSSVGSASWIWCKKGRGLAPNVLDAIPEEIYGHFPAFLLRLDAGECKALEWKPQLNLRLGLLSIGHIPLIYVLLRIQGLGRIYQTWINHSDFMQPSPVYALRERHSIAVFLFEGESTPKQYVEFKTEEFNQRCSQILSSIQNFRQKWTMAEFDIARASISYTAEQLWERG